MASNIEFNHIMHMLNEIRIGGAKSQGYSVVFFAMSLSVVFFSLSETVKDNFLYIIFGWYFLIMGFIAMGLTRIIMKNIKRNFSDRMNGIEKLKRWEKGE